jgi:hypothetical protein
MLPWACGLLVQDVVSSDEAIFNINVNQDNNINNNVFIANKSTQY